MIEALKSILTGLLLFLVIGAGLGLLMLLAHFIALAVTLQLDWRDPLSWLGGVVTVALVTFALWAIGTDIRRSGK